jgi:hypothetical protein
MVVFFVASACLELMPQADFFSARSWMFVISVHYFLHFKLTLRKLSARAYFY